MKVYFERSGGFMGLHLQTIVDTADLPEEEAEEWERTLTAAGFFSLPSSREAESGADASPASPGCWGDQAPRARSARRASTAVHLQHSPPGRSDRGEGVTGSAQGRAARPRGELPGLEGAGVRRYL